MMYTVTGEKKQTIKTKKKQNKKKKKNTQKQQKKSKEHCMAFQEAANTYRACDLALFAFVTNLASLIRNPLEFEDIMLINFASDGQEIFFKQSLLKPLYMGHTNRK